MAAKKSSRPVQARKKVVAPKKSATKNKVPSRSSANEWKQARIATGMTAAELARKAGVSAKTLDRLEKDNPAVKPEMRSRVLNALQASKPDLSVAHLLNHS